MLIYSYVHANSHTEMIKLLLVFSVLFLSCINLYSQKDLYSENLGPDQLDSFEDQVLIVGYNWDKDGILSVFLKKGNETTFTNISTDIENELQESSKVHFDNVGRIWAFGVHNILVYENDKWHKFPKPKEILSDSRMFDFCFDSNNDIYGILITEYVRFRDTLKKLTVLDSINYDFVKYSNKTHQLNVIKKVYDSRKSSFNSIPVIISRPDDAIVCLLMEDTNNIMVYKDGHFNYETIPMIHDGFQSIVTSMFYDNSMNMWLSVKNSYQLYFDCPANGVHKFSPNGDHIKWDSSVGLKGQLYNLVNPPATLGVNKIVFDKKTGIVWGGTDFGLFSIDEKKSRKEQLTFYTRDSIDSRYRKTILGGYYDWALRIIDVCVIANNIYFAHSLALIEMNKNYDGTSIFEYQSEIPSISVDIYPTPSLSSKVEITIKSHTTDREVTLEIVDLSGKSLQRFLVKSISGQIQIPVDTKDFPKGTYFAVVNIGGKFVSKKFLIK
jgi:hypothetical protein